MPHTRYTYRVYGEVISCNFPVPGWFVEDANTKPSLFINLGRHASQQQDDLELIYSSIHYRKLNQPLFRFYSSVGNYIFKYPDIADYCLSVNSGQIQINFYDNADHREVLYFLIKGPILTLWLTLNQMICLHASAVVIRGKAVGFLAPSLSGKSTLGLSFLEKGFQLVCDDILAIKSGHENLNYFARPSMPIIKTRDSIGSDCFDLKARLPIKSPGKNDNLIDILDVFPLSWEADQIPMSKLYLLDRGGSAGEIKTKKLRPNETLFNLIANLQAGLILEKLELFKQCTQHLAILAEEMPISKLQYPSGLKHISDVTEFIIQDCA